MELKTLLIFVMFCHSTEESNQFFKARRIVSKNYTDYLKSAVSWEVREYKDNIFKGWADVELKNLLGEISIATDTEFAKIETIEGQSMRGIESVNSLDWSLNSCIQPIRKQGECAACWAFTVAGMVSDRCCLNGRDHGWLSAQELLSCDSNNVACIGGNRKLALMYVEKHGLVPEECYPYKERNGTCPSSCNRGQDWERAHVCKCTNVRQCKGEKGIMECLKTGPVAAGMSTYVDLLYYKDGIYKHDDNSWFMGFHSIKIVGYGSEYWKCANSWGTEWGINGYFKIFKGECDIENREPMICDPIP